MFGIGGFEFFIILVFAFLIFGPDKLPEIATKVGKGLSKFSNAKDKMDTVVRQDMASVKRAVDRDDEMPEEPFKKSLETFESITRDTAKSFQQDSFSKRKAAHDQERAAREAAQSQIDQAAGAAQGFAMPAGAESVGSSQAAVPAQEPASVAAGEGE